MTGTDDVPSGNADAELEELVSRLLDGVLDRNQHRRLEQRLRDDPAARAWCVRHLRFDALLQEALNPEPLEMEETRRVVFHPRNSAHAWIVERLQTIRGGRGDGGRVRRRRLWWLAAALGLAAAGIFYGWHGVDAWRLRNGDFEAMDLTRSPRGLGTSILDWQDYFRSANAALCEIGRVSGGKIFAKSGRNVVRLDSRGFLTQRLMSRKEAPLKARPGLTVVLTGWSYCEGRPPFRLRGSLRFVASAYPEMIQYEAAFATAELSPGGWHPFEIRLTLPDDLNVPPSDVFRDSSSAMVFRKHERTILADNSPPPTADLTGKDLTLSIDQDSPGVTVYLDDLGLQVSGSAK